MVSSTDDPPPEIGLTGARFGGPSRRRRSRAERAADREGAHWESAHWESAQKESAQKESAGCDAAREPVEDPPPVGAVGLTGARFGGSSRTRREAAKRTDPPATPSPGGPAPVPPAPAPPAAGTGPAPSRPGPRPPEPDPAPPADPSPYTLVRPYVLTGGRTRAGVEFAIEALITSAPRPGSVGEPVEHVRIRVLCGAPRSVAEVAARLDIPLGVARVLLADMLAAGSVQVHRTVDAGGPDLALLERVLSGLRRL